jgi:hypothetical protein
MARLINTRIVCPAESRALRVSLRTTDGLAGHLKGHQLVRVWPAKQDLELATNVRDSEGDSTREAACEADGEPYQREEVSA